MFRVLQEVNRVLGLGFATKDGATFIPMSAEEVAKQEPTKTVNVDEFFTNLRGAASVEFGWVV